jgi:hypothetical protein
LILLGQNRVYDTARLGGAGGSFTSDEMAEMNSRQADPTSKDDDRRNVVLDLAGDEGSVGDLSSKIADPLKWEVEKSDRPFLSAASPPTFGQLYKRDSRVGRDTDDLANKG